LKNSGYKLEVVFIQNNKSTLRKGA